MNAGLPGNLTAASQAESFSRKQERYSPAQLNDTVRIPNGICRKATSSSKAIERRLDGG